MTVHYPPANLAAVTLGRQVDRATDTLPQTATEDLFSITGTILLTGVLGQVTTVIQTQTNATKLTFDPDDGGSDIDLCATTDITADAVGTLYTVTGDLSDALQAALDVAETDVMMEKRGIVLTAGDIKLDCAASNTGSVSWRLWYVPLTSDALVEAV